MRHNTIRLLVCGFTALALAESPALAQGAGAKQKESARQTSRDQVPPGLAKKPGAMPPGQYKKRYGTREGATVLGDIFGRNGYKVQRITTSGESHVVHYRMPDGTIRRAIVSPGTERLQFSNVPTTLLQQVLARLY